jgi:hypothetical protein
VTTRASPALLNENGKWVLRVLDSVKKLRRAYREAAPEDTDDLKKRDLELRSLLRDEESRCALDQELKARRFRRDSLDNRAMVEREVALCEKFGYTRREVMRYVSRARTAAASGKPHQEIENTMQLVEHIKLLCDQTIHEFSGHWPWWSRARNVKRIRSMAEDRLFGIGALVADVAQRSNFELSYTLAAITLSRDET